MTIIKHKTIHLIFLIIFLTVILPVFVAAQDNDVKTGPSEPSQTEIVLPEMYLEIEDLSIEEINAVIPDDDAVLLSSIEFPLPEPKTLKSLLKCLP